MATQKELAANFEALSDPNIGRVVMVGLGIDRNSELAGMMGGRSDGSRNRYYQLLEDLSGHGDYIKTAVHDPSKVTGDPSTTLYIAHRQRDNCHVVSNGEQTEGISVALALARKWGIQYEAAFADAQGLYQTEGPKADYTARVSAAMWAGGPFPGDIAVMGRIVRDPQDFTQSIYQVWRLELKPGEFYWISTYAGNGTTEPSYEPPRKILLPGDFKDNMDMVWESYSPDIRAGLVGKVVERGSGRFDYYSRSIHPGRNSISFPD